MYTFQSKHELRIRVRRVINVQVRSSVHKGWGTWMRLKCDSSVPVVVGLISHPTVNSPLLSLGLLDVIATVVS